MDRLQAYAHLSTDKLNKRGEARVQIYILRNTKLIRRISTDIWLLPTLWDNDKKQVKKSTHANQLNARIEKKLDDAKRILNKLLLNETTDKETVLQALKGNTRSSGLLAFFGAYIDQIELPRKDGPKSSAGTIKKWRREYNRLKKYAPEVTFKQITTSWLEDYELHNSQTLTAGTSLPITMRLLIEILRKAHRKGLFDISAIADYKPPQYKTPNKPYLTLEQTEKILGLLLNGEFAYDKRTETTAAFFLVECYSGLRISDWGAFTIEKLLDNDSLKVVTKKTGVPIYLRFDQSPRLQQVIDFIKDRGLVFKMHMNDANKCLKHVGGRLSLPFPLSSHVGRHTCATLFLNKGYSPEMVAEILGVTPKTAMTYGRITRVKLNREYEQLGGL